MNGLQQISNFKINGNLLVKPYRCRSSFKNTKFNYRFHVYSEEHIVAFVGVFANNLKDGKIALKKELKKINLI